MSVECHVVVGLLVMLTSKLPGPLLACVLCGIFSAEGLEQLGSIGLWQTL